VMDEFSRLMTLVDEENKVQEEDLVVVAPR
jgi:hypothetical protein